jgi:drug/metabolite transporter (DMT)-like permease
MISIPLHAESAWKGTEAFMPLQLILLAAFVAGIMTSTVLFLLSCAVCRWRHPQVQVVQIGVLGEPFIVPPPARRRWWQARWLRSVARSIVLAGAALLANALYASFAIAQDSLHRIDPLIFVAIQMALLLPGAGVFLWGARGSAAPRMVRQGMIGGLFLGIGFVLVALSLRTLGILPTAMLTALDGVMASGISWLILRQRQPFLTWLAAFCAGCGSLLLWWITPGAWQADIVALGCGLCFTLYAFHVERCGIVHLPHKHRWAFFGGLIGAMAAVAIVLALSFGYWPSLGAFTLTDLEIVCYASWATVLLPILLFTFLLRSASAVTVAFFSILEPLMSIGFASALGTLSLPLLGWIGVGGILVSVLVQSGAAALSNTSSRGSARTMRVPPHAATSNSRVPAIAGNLPGEPVPSEESTLF